MFLSISATTRSVDVAGSLFLLILHQGMRNGSKSDGNKQPTLSTMNLLTARNRVMKSKLQGEGTNRESSALSANYRNELILRTGTASLGIGNDRLVSIFKYILHIYPFWFLPFD